MDQKETTKRVISLITTTAFLFISTYIWFNFRTLRTTAQPKYFNNKFLEIIETNNGNQENIFPTTDEDGFKQDGSIIKVKNNSNKNIQYKLLIVPNNSNTLNSKYIKYSYSINGGEYSNPKAINNDNLIAIDNISNYSINTYNIKMWIDYNAGNDIMNKTYTYRLGLESI